MSKPFFIKDPIHKEIVFNDDDAWMRDLINTKEFQRLTRIKQLGVSYCMFPSATHTRFSHSLGVFETARCFFEHISKIINTTLKQRKTVLTAALLHDIGHGPCSHTFEYFTGFDHESMTSKLILNPQGEIYPILLNNDVDPNEVVQIIEKKHKDMWMSDLISSQIDADRLDYLLRDSHHTGANYGVIDINIIAQRLVLHDNRIAFNERAIIPIENFLFGRYHMYRSVYQNHHTEAYAWLIKSILRRAKDLYVEEYKFIDPFKLMHLLKPYFENTSWSINNFLNLDDFTFKVILDGFGQENDITLRELVKALINPITFNLIPYDELLSKKYLKILKDKNLDPKYFYEEIDPINPTLYNKERQPIWILNSSTGSLDRFEEVSLLLNSQSNFKKITHKNMIINNKIINI